MHIPFTYCSLMFSPDSYIFCLKPHHDRDLRILAHLVTSPFAPKSSLALQKACLLLYSFSPFLTEISMSCGLGNGTPQLSAAAETLQTTRHLLVLPFSLPLPLQQEGKENWGHKK